MNITETTETLSKYIPLVIPLVEKVVVPNIKKLKKSLQTKKVKTEVLEEYWSNLFTNYLERTYKKLSIINTLVYPNQQIDIKEIYYPLKIRSIRNNKIYLIDKFKIEYIEPCKKMLISDQAGMGKSTLVKWIGLSLINQQLSIPILIELRKLSRSNNIVSEIKKQLSDISSDFDMELFYNFLDLGCFTILLDGYDEIPFDNRDVIISDIKEFISKTDKNWFVLTSRPESSLASFGDFQNHEIEPLKENESYAIIKKYDDLNKNKIYDKLISDIKENYNQAFDLLSNPFLVSLLYMVYTFTKDIPAKKSTFYSSVFSALFREHDLTKDAFQRKKRSKLEISDFKRVLQNLAFSTSKEGKIEYSKDEILIHLEKIAKLLPSISFIENEFLEDLVTTVPLFIKDGPFVKWSHKSFQDYFTAEFIAAHMKKQDIIMTIIQAENYSFLNTIEFLTDLEPEIFRKVVLKSLFEDFILYCDSHPFTGNSYNKMDIRMRQIIGFFIEGCYTFQFVKASENEKDLGLSMKSSQQRASQIFPNLTDTTNIRHLSDKLEVCVHIQHKYYYHLLKILRQFCVDVKMAFQDFEKYHQNNLECSSLSLGYINLEHFDEKHMPIYEFKAMNYIVITSMNLMPKKVNNMDINNMFEYFFLLDYDKCQLFLSKLENEIIFEKEDDVLSGF